MNIIPNSETFCDHNINWQLLIGEPRDEHYTHANTLHYQVFDFVPDYVKEFAERNFKIFSTSTMKQMPGQFIPNHTDKYYYFRNKNNIEDEDSIVRYCVFLEDWQPGHYFEVDNEPLIQWTRGQYVVLKKGLYHRSANAGNVPKYTSQITGILK